MRCTPKSETLQDPGLMAGREPAAGLGLMIDLALFAWSGWPILVLSLPFLLFAFVTTLLNHIQLVPVRTRTTCLGSFHPGSMLPSR